MTRGIPASRRLGAMPLVTQLTAEQLRDLPTMAPAIRKEANSGVSQFDNISATNDGSLRPAITDRDPLEQDDVLAHSRNLTADRTLRDEITRRGERDQRFTIDEVRQMARKLCDLVEAQPTIVSQLRPETVCLLEDGSLTIGKPDGSRASEVVCRTAYRSDDGQRRIAILLFELLTGYTPGDPMAPHELRKNVPRQLSLAIQRALSPDPRHRFASAREFRRQLLEPISGWRHNLTSALSSSNRGGSLATDKTVPPEDVHSAPQLTGRLNLRWTDNVAQAKTVLLCVAVCAQIGAVSLMNESWLAGAIIGGFLGLIVGLIVSGLVACFKHYFTQSAVILLCATLGAVIGYFNSPEPSATGVLLLFGGFSGLLISAVSCGFVGLVSYLLRLARRV